ncbi:IS66 family insertion sequence element accessory protein TnpB [Pseudoalteromonas sp. NBT06-2]|uniref:IS66 family insertion sequence element accessory protein TnpB n=1 Tax=Pseudoalteromonas sp. NBT06-2 TaxID=2025950 RepID=UPI001140A6D6|nr:IS66 family insertion sequence element accessory protein TnpB [Pseudoalteromonas sp. NBT06-2]
MIHLTADTHILVAIAHADFRQGIDGLAAICRHKLIQNPRSGTVFVLSIAIKPWCVHYHMTALVFG